MRIRKCKKCGAKLKGIQRVCPECESVFLCDCGSELPDNKFKECPICRQVKTEKRIKFWGKVVGVAATSVAAVVTGRALYNKFSHDDQDEEDDFNLNILDDDDPLNL